jgi:hypothetical protein
MTVVFLHWCLIFMVIVQNFFPGYNKSFPGGGAKWIPAWQLHAKDPTLVLWKACYNNLNGDLKRKGHMARLHVYPDGFEGVPDEIATNLTGQVSLL